MFKIFSVNRDNGFAEYFIKKFIQLCLLVIAVNYFDVIKCK